MQHLLDFIHEHTLEEQLYLSVDAAFGELELTWQRRVSFEHWQVRWRKLDGPAELVHRTELLSLLEARRADMLGIERELHAIVSTQIAFADMVLSNASAALGADLVQRAVLGHQQFAAQLEAAVTRLAGTSGQAAHPRPAMTVVVGGGERSETRSGHLTLVP